MYLLLFQSQDLSTNIMKHLLNFTLCVNNILPIHGLTVETYSKPMLAGLFDRLSAQESCRQTSFPVVVYKQINPNKSDWGSAFSFQRRTVCVFSNQKYLQRDTFCIYFKPQEDLW